MEKYLKCAVLTLLFAFVFSFGCEAATEQEALLEDFLKGAPNEFANATADYASVEEKIGFNGLVKAVSKAIASCFPECAALFAAVCGAVLLYSLLDAFELGFARSHGGTASTVVSAAIVTACAAPIADSINSIKEAVETMRIFCAAAVPSVTALCVSSGEAFSAAVFSSGISLATAVFGAFSEGVLIPLSVVFMSFGLVNGMYDSFDAASVCGCIKRFIKWTIGVFIGLFTFSVSLRGVLSHSADSLVKKGIKTAVGSLVPVVGSTLSSGVDSIFMLAANSKTSFSVLGTVIILSVFLPPVTECLCYGVMLSIARAFSSFLKLQGLGKTIGFAADAFFVLAGICCAGVYTVIASFLLICVSL